MKNKGWRGRLILLTCLLSWTAAVAQTPAPSPRTTPAPAVVASPSPSITETPQTVSAPATPATVAPGPATVASPLPAAPPAAVAAPQLNLPTQSDKDALAQYQTQGKIGRSTFVDKARTVTWVLAFICFLIYLLGKVVSRSTLERIGLPTEPDSLIEVIEKKRLSPGRSIMLLRVGPKVLAVAVTESGFRTLTEIDAESLKQHQDERSDAKAPPDPTGDHPAPSGPAHIAKHYLSIIPGLGAKK